FGNTSAASIPIALWEMEEKGLLKEGHLVLAVAFGAGFVWGGMLLRW
ncbi:MAG: 3-oxoacyl-[acyl-carrier-protein] synthase III C-terminal domain-containing protein, partial [candidate division WOR-3 bacterium]